MKIHKQYLFYSLIFGFATLLLLFTSCTGLNKLSSYNFASSYMEKNASKKAEFRLFQVCNDSVRAYVSVDLSGFETREIAQSGLYLDYSLRFFVYDEADISKVPDTFIFQHTELPALLASTAIENECSFLLKDEGAYLIELRIKDLNSEKEIRLLRMLDNKGHSPASSFLPVNQQGDILYNDDRFRKGKTIELQTALPQESFWVYYFSQDVPIAEPPFVYDDGKIEALRPDSLFRIYRNINHNVTFTPFAQGAYFILSDTNSKQGYTAMVFGNAYPKIQYPIEMLMPLRYISSANEFAELLQYRDAKLAVDSFWVANAGNPERARRLISTYYGRVERANDLFSSWKQGWQTDRGLIYIMYGEPHIVYKSPNAESWIYGEESNYKSIRFDFQRIDNPLSKTDFKLLRQPEYKSSWYYQVDRWRR